MTHSVAVEGHRLIRAPLQRVWHLLSRLEAHPRYVTLWMAADVHERSPTSALVEFRGFFGGLPIASAQRITLRPPTRLEFRQVRGELRELTGAYVLKEVDGETDVTIQLSIDADILVFPDASVHQIIVGHIDGTLGRIKASAERDLVRLTPRRLRTPDASAAAVSSAEGEPSAATGPGPDLSAPGSRPPSQVIVHPEAHAGPARTGGAPLRSSSGAPAQTSASEQRPHRIDGRRRRRRRRRGRGGGPVPSAEGGGQAGP